MGADDASGHQEFLGIVPQKGRLPDAPPYDLRCCIEREATVPQDLSGEMSGDGFLYDALLPCGGHSCSWVK